MASGPNDETLKAGEPDGVDPIEEAEVFLAYGREAHALAILDAAASTGNTRAREAASQVRGGRYVLRNPVVPVFDDGVDPSASPGRQKRPHFAKWQIYILIICALAVVGWFMVSENDSLRRQFQPSASPSGQQGAGQQSSDPASGTGTGSR